MNLVQLYGPGSQGERRVAQVEGSLLLLLRGFASVYQAAQQAVAVQRPLTEVVADAVTDEALDYDAIYAGRSEWRLLPPLDHPLSPTYCFVSGTGLTHRRSADTRHAMHQANRADAESGVQAPPLTDSMRIYQWGEEGGRPASGEIGTQPEWFYKGDGAVLSEHNAPLTVPAYAEDGGEEPELAALYVIDPQGQPWRVGFAIGNEFSDHRMEQRNYLYLAHSKLRKCSLGPELRVGDLPSDVRGTVRIERAGKEFWSREIASGEANMVHSLENLEHHHFKYPAHRRPDAVHIHFLGTAGFSFGAGIELKEGDLMEIAFEGFGRPLRNPIHVDPQPLTPTRVRAL